MNKRRLFLPLVALILLCGCQPASPGLPDPPAESDMAIHESGDITLRDSYVEQFSTRSYSFDSAPTVLIYHTHATEAFRQEGDYTYEETDEWRTDDNQKNIVYAGEVLAELLKEQGFRVIHDTANVEQPEFRTAYSRSLEVMQQYPDADIYLDLHRNAANVEKSKGDIVMLDGKRCARMFFVVGTGIGTYEGEYDVAPDWLRNYQFALSVGEQIASVDEGLMRSIRLKVGRYNQHMGLCLLAEVGHNANTLEDVLNTLPYFAKGLRAVCKF